MRDMKQDFEFISSSLTNIVTKMTEFSLTPKILSLTELNMLFSFAEPNLSKEKQNSVSGERKTQSCVLEQAEAMVKIHL